jgi:hypothetical protein
LDYISDFERYHIDKKWLNMISGSLKLFKWINPDTAVCRCPICGDSQKNTRKTRGYLFKNDNKLKFKCHNCGISLHFNNLLFKVAPGLYKEYKLDIVKESLNKPTESKPDSEAPEEITFESDLSSTKSILDLPKGHPARKYCEGRRIPEESLSRILHTENFSNWIINVLGMTKYKTSYGSRLPSDKRILLPMKDVNGNIIGVQGRTYEDNSKQMRYITIKKADHLPKIFGLENINTKTAIFAVEGPIDSLFLPNCIAFCGGDVNIPIKDIEPSSVYVLMDNEPRNKDTVKRMNKAIEKGYNVVFWKYQSNLKDINDFIKSGESVRDILKEIKENSYSGVHAKMELSKWKRCIV